MFNIELKQITEKLELLTESIERNGFILKEVSNVITVSKD